MRLRPRTLRRLGIFLMICAIGAATVWAYRGHVVDEREQSLRRARERGLSAFTMGDMPAAISALSLYLGESRDARTPQDFDAAYALAAARAMVPSPGQRHLEQSESLVQELLNRLPEHPRRREARHLLMHVLARQGNWAALRQASEGMLADFPEDPVALRMRRISYEHTGDLPTALESAMRLNEIDPYDLDDQIQTFRLLRATGAEAQSLIERAIEVGELRPGNPDSLVLLAIAYQNAGHLNQALTTIREATRRLGQSRNPVDLARRLAGLCDALEWWKEGDAVLLDGVSNPDLAPGDRSELAASAALRLWQIGEAGKAMDLLLSYPPPETRAEVPALVVATIIGPDGSDERRVAAEMLRQAARDESIELEHRRLASAVAEAVSARLDDGEGDGQTIPERVEAMERALLRLSPVIGFTPMFADEPFRAVVQQWLGDLWQSVGETSLATQHWRLAAEASPGWARPYLSIGQASRSKGQLEQATAAAQEARLRQRGGLADEADALLARLAFARYLSSPSNAEADRATLLVSDYLQKNPDDTTLLPAQLRLVAIRDQKAAEQLLDEALERDLPPRTRLELARAAETARIAPPEPLIADLQTPEATLFEAERLAAMGRAQEGRRLLEQKVADAGRGAEPGSRQEMSANLALARFLEANFPADAPDQWRLLGRKWEHQARIQAAILREAKSLAADRAFLTDTIERLRMITGDAGRQWRLARARWLLSDPQPEAAMEAAAILRVLIRGGSGEETIDARLLLAEGLSAGGNTQAAIDHLQTAFDMDPRRGDVGLRLVALLEQSGQIERAGRVLGRLAAEGVSGAAERLEVANRLAMSGNPSAAVSLLSQADLAGSLESLGRAVLADLLTQTGRVEEAENLYERLLDVRPTPPTVWLEAAVFFHEQGRTERAAQILELVAQSSLSQVEKDVVRATFFARTGRAADAAAAFDAALAEEPTNASPYREAAAFELSRGNAHASRQISEKGLAQHPADEKLLVIAAIAAAEAFDSPETNDLERLAAFASQLRRHRHAMLRADEIELLDELSSRALPQWSEVDLVRADVVANKLPLLGALQRLLATAFLNQDQEEAAARVARRWAEAARHNRPAQRMAYFLARQAERPDDAERHARRWRTLAEGEQNVDAVLADAALADALLLRGEVDPALALLEPRLPEAQENPEENRPLLLIAARTLARAGRPDEAFTLLRPGLADNDSRWRADGLALAADVIDDAVEAASWIRTIEAQLSPEAALDEHLAVVEAWIDLGRRLDHPEALRQAEKRLAGLLEGRASDSTRAWRLAAQLGRATDAPASTERALRRILALTPRDAAAANDLAFLLLTEHLDLSGPVDETPPLLDGKDEDDSEQTASVIVEEALGWAEVAVAAVPDNPIYQDTLARAQRWAGEEDEARETFGRALRLDVTYLDAMLGLADLYLASDQHEQAQRLFQRLEPLYRQSSEVHPHLKAEFDRLARAFPTDAG